MILILGKILLALFIIFLIMLFIDVMTHPTSGFGSSGSGREPLTRKEKEKLLGRKPSFWEWW